MEEPNFLYCEAALVSQHVLSLPKLSELGLFPKGEPTQCYRGSVDLCGEGVLGWSLREGQELVGWRRRLAFTWKTAWGRRGKSTDLGGGILEPDGQGVSCGRWVS